MSTSVPNTSPRSHEDEIKRLAGLGPEAQGDVDDSLLIVNLSRTPAERIRAASEIATQVQMLQRAVNAAIHT